MNYPTSKQVGKLSYLAKKYVSKLPDRITNDGQVNRKFQDFEVYVAVQNQGIVSGLIETLADEAIPEEVKESQFNLFLTKGQ